MSQSSFAELSALLHLQQNPTLGPALACPSTTNTPPSLLNSAPSSLHDLAEVTNTQTHAKKVRTLFRADSKRSSATHLMTPPSTPASSLRNTSFGTTTSDLPRTAFDPDEGLTRFLKMSNVPQIFKLENLISALDSPRCSGTTADQVASAASAPSKDLDDDLDDDRNPLKCLLNRYHAERGVLLAVFHDLRDAQKVKRSIDASSSEKEEDLTCEYLTPEEMIKLGLDPQIALSCNSRFYVSVTSTALPATDFAPPSAQSINSTPNRIFPQLKNILATFGDLWEFQQELHMADHEQVFRVDYFDARHAESAYDWLSRTMVLCGMRLRLFKSVNKDEGSKAACRPKEGQLDPSSVPFPSPPDTGDACKAHLPAADEQARPRSASAGQSNVSPTSLSALGVILDGHRHIFDPPEPNSGPAILPPQQQQDLNARRPSNSLFFDATAKSKNMTHARRPRSLSFDQSSAGETAPVPEVSEDVAGAERELPLHSPSYPSHVEHEQDRAEEMYYVTPHYPSSPTPATSYFHSPYTFPAPASSDRTFPARFPISPVHGPPVFDAFTQYVQDPVFAPPHPHSGAQDGYYAQTVSPLGMPGMFYSHQVPRIPMQINSNYAPPAPVPLPIVPPEEILRLRLSEAHISPLNTSLYHSPRASSMVTPQQRSPPLVPTGFGRSRRHAPQHERSSSPERNQLSVSRIEEGMDMRTTVMVKNIPNKMSDKDLENFIARVCPRKIDFMYLRMDFQNGCNVGYAFVNFITVQDLLAFAKAKLGVKWNMYHSDKVLQMSYANYQGKEALVEKFKNSCIMDERPGWRPRIFYSDGPNQGLPEDFPAPTHLRRKERSTHNRGMLFTPGLNSRSGPLRHLHNQGEFRN